MTQQRVGLHTGAWKGFETVSYHLIFDLHGAETLGQRVGLNTES
jgi:hypothetical protein